MKCSVYRIMFTAWENLGKMLLASKLFLRRKSRKLRSRGKTECNLFALTLKYASSASDRRPAWGLS